MSQIVNKLHSNSALPLQAKKILVTRAREQASQFAARLTELGAKVLEFPVIKIVEPADYRPLDNALARLSEFDWLIFTSANAVEYFCRRLPANANLPSGLKVCAIGPATAECCQAHAIKPDLLPKKAVAESIVEAMGNVAGQNILFPAAELARETLAEGLSAKGANLERVTVYRNVLPEDEPGMLAVGELVSLLESGSVDFATFTASSTVKNLAARLATASPQSFAELMSRTTIACIGPITAGTARELGLTVHIEATEFTTEKLAEALLNFLQQDG